MRVNAPVCVRVRIAYRARESVSGGGGLRDPAVRAEAGRIEAKAE